MTRNHAAKVAKNFKSYPKDVKGRLWHFQHGLKTNQRTVGRPDFIKSFSGADAAVEAEELGERVSLFESGQLGQQLVLDQEAEANGEAEAGIEWYYQDVEFTQILKERSNKMNFTRSCWVVSCWEQGHFGIFLQRYPRFSGN